MGTSYPRVVKSCGRSTRRTGAAAAGGAAPATTSISAPSSAASQAASAAGSLASGAGRRQRRGQPYATAPRPSRRPAFSAQSSSVRVAATLKRGSRVGEGPGRLLDREEADAALRLGGRGRLRRGGPEAEDEGTAPAGERVAPGAGVGPATAPARGRRRRTRRPATGAAARPAAAAAPSRAGGVRTISTPSAPGMRSSFSMRTKTRTARRSARQPRGDPLGEGLEQVDPLGGERVLDRLGDGVVGDHLVDVVVLGGGMMRDLENDVEADALGDAALGAEGADLDVAEVVAHGDAVERRAGMGGGGPRMRQLEGDRSLVHGTPAPLAEVIAPAAGPASRAARPR